MNNSLMTKLSATSKKSRINFIVYYYTTTNTSA